MKPATIKLMCAIVGLVLGFAAISFIYAWHGEAPAQDTIDAVYPLFSSGISWSPKVSVSLPPRSDYNPATSTIVGYEVVSLPTAPTGNIAGIAEPLRNYYDQLLVSKGWHINTSFEADGPGGSLWGFTKDKDVLIFSYASTFYNQQPNTPEQCPCSIVFTIIGGTLK